MSNYSPTSCATGSISLTAFLEVVDEPEHVWRDIAYDIGNVLQCGEHRGSIDAVLNDGETASALPERESFRSDVRGRADG